MNDPVWLSAAVLVAEAMAEAQQILVFNNSEEPRDVAISFLMPRESMEKLEVALPALRKYLGKGGFK